MTIAIFGGVTWYARAGLGVFSLALMSIFYSANTRSAWLGFIVSFSLIFALRRIKMFVAIFLLAVLLFPFLPRAKMVDIVATNSFDDRFDMWETGWRIFREHPIVGNGLNSFFGKFMEFRNDSYKNKRGSYAHNGYLQIASDTGILGLATFLIILFRAFYSSMVSTGILRGFMRRRADSGDPETRFYHTFAIGLSGALLAFLVHSFFDTNLHSLPLVALFWFALSILLSLRGIYEQKT